MLSTILKKFRTLIIIIVTLIAVLIVLHIANLVHAQMPVRHFAHPISLHHLVVVMQGNGKQTVQLNEQTWTMNLTCTGRGTPQ